ncbi:MAG: L-aspartate oxidase, partial [Bacteroidota bacterium]
KARIDSMHFIQFHPTALKAETGDRAFLISEAVWGFGAILKRPDGSPFMKEYDERGSLASRDIVARAIDTEMKKSGDSSVFLDGRHLDQVEFRERFPTIYNTCLEKGIDPAVAMIPVAPAAHYLCGGIKTDRFGQTSIQRLYCCGEAASTGLHGANRLASNSLLEALVYANRCYLDLLESDGPEFLARDIPDWRTEGTNDPKELVLITHNRRELQQLMSDYVGIVRTNERLNRTLKRLALFFDETEELYQTTTLSPQICELRNLIAVAYLIVRESMEETENVGAFYNTDLES